MTIRVREVEVRQIINTSFDPIYPFLVAANLFVDETLSGQGYEDAYLKEIERWVAAHFIAVADPRLKSKRIDDAQEDYNIQWAKPEAAGLHTTHYGRTAVMMDTSGILSRMGKRKIVIQNINDGDRTHDGTWSAS